MATKQEISEAFDNAILLPVIFRDEPNNVCEDRMFLRTDIDPDELETDPRDADVFFYAPADATEESLRAEFSSENSGDNWFIPSPAEVKALEDPYGMREPLPPHTHKYLEEPNLEGYAFMYRPDWRRGLLSPEKVFMHLKWEVITQSRSFARINALKAKYRMTEKAALVCLNELLAKILVALQWGLIDRGQYDALYQHIFEEYGKARNDLRGAKRNARLTKKGGVK